jgi:transposase
MSNKRKQYNPEFNVKVALAALKDEETLSELVARGVHTTMITAWTRTLLDGVPDIFDKGQKSEKQAEVHVDELYKQIGWPTGHQMILLLLSAQTHHGQESGVDAARRRTVPEDTQLGVTLDEKPSAKAG